MLLQQLDISGSVGFACRCLLRFSQFHLLELRRLISTCSQGIKQSSRSFGDYLPPPYRFTLTSAAYCSVGGCRRLTATDEPTHLCAPMWVIQMLTAVPTVVAIIDTIAIASAI